MKTIAITPVTLLGIVGAITIVAVAAACGGGSAASPTQHVHEDGTAHDHDALDSAVETATPIPTGVIDDYVGCMEARGYRSTQDGVVMPDGTVWKQPEVGTPAPLPPVALRNAEYECRIESGFEAVAAERGDTSDFDEDQVDLLNERMVAAVRCLLDRGWAVSPPVLDAQLGLLINEYQPESEDQAAYDLDKAECWIESDTPE